MQGATRKQLPPTVFTTNRREAAPHGPPPPYACTRMRSPPRHRHRYLYCKVNFHSIRSLAMPRELARHWRWPCRRSGQKAYAYQTHFMTNESDIPRIEPEALSWQDTAQLNSQALCFNYVKLLSNRIWPIPLATIVHTWAATRDTC